MTEAHTAHLQSRRAESQDRNEGSPIPYSFSKRDRILRQVDFDGVHRSRFFAADQTLVVKAACNDLPHARLGLSLSRQVGNAVARNRWKRVIRSAFRLSRDQIPGGLDLVVRPRKGAKVDFEAVRHSLVALSRRLHRKMTTR